jgi:7-cyano-7-deazaguanosine (preQ0) biosynthesis protein QueE
VRVCEVFGPTFQGEGPSLGRRAVFVRLAGCNLDCAWCDTPYAWDWQRFDRREQSRPMDPAEVAAWASAQRTELVVVTGGEPLLQRRVLTGLVETMAGSGLHVEVETNGTIPPGEGLLAAVIRFNVSPKLAGSGIDRSRRIRPAVLRGFAACGKAVFKFVIADDADVHELAGLEQDLDLAPIWVMPLGRDPGQVLDAGRRLAPVALAHGWNLTTRLHVLLWGDERGR